MKNRLGQGVVLSVAVSLLASVPALATDNCQVEYTLSDGSVLKHSANCSSNQHCTRQLFTDSAGNVSGIKAVCKNDNTIDPGPDVEV